MVEPLRQPLDLMRDPELRHLHSKRIGHLRCIQEHEAAIRELDAQIRARGEAILQQWCEQRARW